LRPIANNLLAVVLSATFLAGCATNEQGQLVIDPNKVNQVLAGALTPPPPPPPVVVEEAYEQMPSDVYITTVVDRDVVIVGGNTYIWVVGPDGGRHRQFYAHGDHRQDVFHRRDELHRVMASHGGHLPDHAIAAHSEMQHAGSPASGTQKPGVMPVVHAASPAKSAPKLASKDTKKS
jgi:hypothetical protein